MGIEAVITGLHGFADAFLLGLRLSAQWSGGYASESEEECFHIAVSVHGF
jgi:hypothetical protein